MEFLTNFHVNGLVVLLFIGFSDAITWVNPTDQGDLSPSVREDSTGDLGITISADFLSSTKASVDAYTIVQQEETGMFTLDEDNGGEYVLRLANRYTLDFETKSSYVFVLKAKDIASNTATITCTLTITDINEKPIFSASDYIFSIPDGSGERTAVGTVNATDLDSDATGNIVTYSISAGNLANMFNVSSTGVISVANGKMVSASTKMFYTLTITATSSGAGSPQPSETTIVRIAICAKDAAMSLSGRGTAIMAAIFIGFRVFYTI